MARGGLILLALAVACFGCGWGDEDAPPEPTSRRPGIGAVAPSRPAAEAPAEPLYAPKETTKFEPFDWDEFDGEAEASGTKKDEKPEVARDYAEELRTAVGSPVGCLQPRRGDEVPPKISIGLTAVVMDSGRITRGNASSAQLEPAEVECITRRLKAARIPGNVEGSPRTVNATVTLELKKPEKKPVAGASSKPSATDTRAQ